MKVRITPFDSKYDAMTLELDCRRVSLAGSRLNAELTTGAVFAPSEAFQRMIPSGPSGLTHLVVGERQSIHWQMPLGVMVALDVEESTPTPETK